MQSYIVTSGPDEYPVTLSEAKAYMKITNDAEDDIITSLIIAATDMIERFTGRVFVQRDITGLFSTLLTSYKTEVYPFVKIYRAPLLSISSVQVSVDNSFIDESYQEKILIGYPRVLFDDFTNVLDDIPYPLRIEFTAGYGDASAVPTLIKIAIKMYVNFLYRNRGDCVDASCAIISEKGLPPGIASMLYEYKIIDSFA